MQGIYTETNYVPREYSVAANLLLLFAPIITGITFILHSTCTVRVFLL